MIHMKCQILFFLKNKKINFRMSSATNLPNALMMMSSGLTTHQPMRVICVKMVN